MIKRSTWITLLIFFILLGAAYGLKRYKKIHPGGGTPTPTPEAHAFNFNIDDIVELKIVSRNAPKVLIQRKDPKSPWQVVIPAQKGKADQARIEEALYNLTMLTILNYPQDTDPKVLGLDTPAYVISVRLKDGKRWVMEIGKQTPIKSGYYAKVGDKIMVIDSYPIEGLKNLLNHPPVIKPTATPTPTGTSKGKPTPTPTSKAETETPTPTPTP